VVEEERTVSEAAEAAVVSVRCARKWVAHYRAEGEAGLLDRSSAPRSIPHRTSEQRMQAIPVLRRLRFTGPEIAEVLGMAISTVSGILTRLGMRKLGRLSLEAARRYERARPGELIHIDVKKLGRSDQGAGHRVTAHRRDTGRRTDAAGIRRIQVGWEYVTPPSMTRPALPMPRCSETRRGSPRLGSSREPWRSMSATASPSRAS
jgi:hypothetical protein